MRISSPPTQGPCHYGIDTPTRGELIASSHSIEEINQYITSDTLAYLSLDSMVTSVVSARSEATGRSTRRSLPLAPGASNGHGANGHKPNGVHTAGDEQLGNNDFCTACWTGQYPIEFTPHPRQHQMRLLDL